MEFSVGIIGVGNIGTTLLQKLIHWGCTKILLCDLGENRLRGKLLDLSHEALLQGKTLPNIEVVSQYSALTACDVVVITAGYVRSPGMSRQDLCSKNRAIVESIGKALQGSRAIFIVVTNPVDLMAFYLHQILEVPSHQVLGMAGILDSARLQTILSSMLKTSIKSMRATVIGAHNETMVGVRSLVYRDGCHVSKEELSYQQWMFALEQTRQCGGEIVRLLGQGSAYYGPAQSIFRLIEIISLDERAIVSCSVSLNGTYGYRDTDGFCGVPVMLGRSGILSYHPPQLSAKEEEEFHHSVTSLKPL